MSFRCKKCNKKYSVRRVRCSCGGTEFLYENASFNPIFSLKLSVTPAGFPEEVYITLGKSGDIMTFCRSLEKITDEFYVNENGECVTSERIK